jgi:uncharacterized membrane protein
LLLVVTRNAEEISGIEKLKIRVKGNNTVHDLLDIVLDGQLQMILLLVITSSTEEISGVKKLIIRVKQLITHLTKFDILNIVSDGE